MVLQAETFDRRAARQLAVLISRYVFRMVDYSKGNIRGTHLELDLKVTATAKCSF